MEPKRFKRKAYISSDLGSQDEDMDMNVPPYDPPAPSESSDEESTKKLPLDSDDIPVGLQYIRGRQPTIEDILE